MSGSSEHNDVAEQRGSSQTFRPSTVQESDDLNATIEDNPNEDTLSHLSEISTETPTNIVEYADLTCVSTLTLFDEEGRGQNPRSEIVGDDIARKEKHILCECDQPGVAGAAVPMVVSFVQSQKSSKNSVSSAKKPSNVNKKPSLIPKLFKRHKERPGIQEEATPSKNMKNMSSKMLTLQERLKATTSLIKQKLNDEATKEKSNNVTNKRRNQLRFQSEENAKISGFSEKVLNLKRIMLDLREDSTIESQIPIIDNLFNKITILKECAEEFKSTEVETNKNKSKDNKIYIKLLPSKSSTKRKRTSNFEDVPHEQNINENREDAKRSDSVDAIFVPTPWPAEEEDEDCLDITIKFPEIRDSDADGNNSRLSVCFSDISLETLGRVKRCPKEFTLKLDFAQGKMYFKSAKSATNVPTSGNENVKNSEDLPESKASKVISIKPSTECTFTSQLIPVENATEKESLKMLKSTASELFSVVSLPYIRRKSLKVTNSCISFKNYDSSSERASYLRITNSSPQIASSAKILDDTMATCRTVFRKKSKKSCFNKES